MSAYDYLEILERHFVNPSRMGCVMLDVKPVPLGDYLTEGEMQEWGVVDPEYKWVNGFNTAEQHVTLKYGLTKNANIIKDDVDALLAGIDFNADPPVIEHLEFFDSRGDYDCLVGVLCSKLEWDGEQDDEFYGSLDQAHERLSYLPHIDTFPSYRPHVTIGYIRQDTPYDLLNKLGLQGGSEGLCGTVLEPIGLNYGYEPGQR